MDNDLDRLLARRFQTMDDDGNGYVERTDFVVATERLGKEFGHGPESPQLRRLLELTEGWWAHLARVADTNADGRISEAEYKAAFHAGLLETPESFDAVYAPFLAAIMDIIDADHDGRITVTDEIRYVGSLMRISEQDAREIFRHLDRDGDGLATTADLLEAIRGAYFDGSPDSPRYWVLGPLPR